MSDYAMSSDSEVVDECSEEIEANIAAARLRSQQQQHARHTYTAQPKRQRRPLTAEELDHEIALAEEEALREADELSPCRMQQQHQQQAGANADEDAAEPQQDMPYDPYDPMDDGQSINSVDAAEQAADDEAAGLQQEINQLPTLPKGPDAEQFSEFAAFIVAQQAVDPQSPCSVQGCSQPAAVHCCHCGTLEVRVLCAQHDAERHGRAHQHRRFGLLEGHKQPLRPTQQYAPSSSELQDVVLFYDIPPVCPCQRCGSSDWLLNLAVTQHGDLQALPPSKPRKLIIYTSSGRFDYHKACYDCQGAGCGNRQWQDWREFGQMQLWPASLGPQNNTYVEEQLLIMLRRLRFYACGSWEHLADSFDCTGQVVFNQARSCKCRDKRTQPGTLECAYQIYRRLQHHMEQCQGQERWQCPACFENLHSAHADGNMKVWGRQLRQLNYSSLYEDDPGALFLKDRGVLTATTAAGKNRQQPKLCGRSTWSAAGNRAASAGNKLVSGRFITTCSHLTAVKAANMLAEYGGQRYAYSYMMAAELSRRRCKVFFGDLVCKWWPWLEGIVSSNHPALASLPEEHQLTLQQLHQMTPATSAVHSHAHVWYCQVLRGPIYKLLVGLENGEFTELLNAFISRHALAVRSMGLGKSTDYLTENMWDWNWGKILGLAAYVKQRYASALEKLRKAKREWHHCIQDTEQRFNVKLVDAAVTLIGEEVRKAAEGQDKRQPKLGEGSQYMQLIICIQEAKALNDLLSCFNDADIAMSSAAISDVKALVCSVKEQLPRLEREAEALRKSLCPHMSDPPADRAATEQQQPPAATADLSAAAAELLTKLQGVTEQLAALDADDDALARSQLLEVGPQLAAAHSQLHQAVTAAGNPEAQDRWRRQLAEYTLCSYEDDMEAHYLLVTKHESKFSEHMTSKEQKANRERIRTLKASLEKAVDRYNTVRNMGLSARAEVNAAQIIKGELPWTYGDSGPGDMSLKDKMRIWELYNRLKRAEEQKCKVQRDAQAMVKYYQQLAGVLQADAPIHASWLGQHARRAAVQAGLHGLMAAGRQHADTQLRLSQQLVDDISS